ncbi:MAG: ATP synthase F1 subunit gamma [Armatimonadetes bacterium]|nr:ATP synthase F1 subunit gamma [Armatimonadota bacterium]
MATMREIRTRIRTVRNIAKITRAMKLVAAARLKRAQGRVTAARPYAERMQHMMRELSAAAVHIAHPLLEVREERRTAVLVLTSDRGLCGSYNTNVLRKAMELLRGRDPQSVRLLLMGRKGAQFFRRQPYPVVTSLPLSGREVSFADVQPVVATLRQLFEGGEVDAVYVVYARFVNAITQVPTILLLLPLKPPESDAEPGEAAGAATEVIFEPAPAVLLGRLLPRYVDTQVYRALVEAVASEHGARMTSMTAATENASEMIDTLTLSLNRVRQAAITKEIAEIVTGAEAVKR